MWGTSSLNLLPDSLWPRVLVYVGGAHGMMVNGMVTGLGEIDTAAQV